MAMTQPIGFAGDFAVVDVGIYNKDGVLLRAIETSGTFSITPEEASITQTWNANYLLVSPKAGTVIHSAKVDAYSDQPWKNYFRLNEVTTPANSWKGTLDSASFNNTDGTKPNPLTITIVATGKPQTVSQVNQLFLMDDAKLGELAKAPMYLPGGEGEVAFNNSLFIINLLSIPFKIDPSNADKEIDIKLGTFKIGVKAPLMKRDMISVDLGEITVGGMKGNALDYVAAKYELVLPYVAQPIELPPSMVVGKKITVAYKLDAYNGDITVNVL